jgi:YspA, cpYpsA-related SLOG family
VADYRILVTGSRDWQDFARVSFELGLVIGEAYRDGYGKESIVVVHGACPTGADAMAHEICRDYGWREETHPAAWHLQGSAAGPLRNKKMVGLGANVSLAFIRNCSRGASGCADLAEKAGIETRRFAAT